MFSRDEFRDLLITIAGMSLMFSWPDLFSWLPYAFTVAVISVLLHELAHKYVAAGFKVNAVYKIWPFGLLVGAVSILLPPLRLVTLGHTEVYSYRFSKWKRKYAKYSRHMEVTIREVGIISCAGPLMNVFLAISSWFIMAKFFPGNLFLTFMTMVNAWIGLSNLIPVRPLEGAEIFTWKPWFWFLMCVACIIFLFFTVPTFF